MAVTVADITDSNVFEYRDEVIVELHGRTPDGELVAITYQFDPDTEDPTRLSPRGRIEAAHEDAVHDALETADFTLEDSRH